MNIIELIGQRYSLSKKIENKLDDIWNKYVGTKFNICFYDHYTGGAISIFKHPENANYKTYNVKDNKSNYVIRIDVDEAIETLYPETLNTIIKEITGKDFNKIKNNNF